MKLIEEIRNEKIDAIDKYLDDLHALRIQGLTTSGEYSYENLVFKAIRDRGYLDNLKQLKHELISKELSLK